jgi:hypothetical protein
VNRLTAQAAVRSVARSSANTKFAARPARPGPSRRSTHLRRPTLDRDSRCRNKSATCGARVDEMIVVDRRQHGVQPLSDRFRESFV